MKSMSKGRIGEGNRPEDVKGLVSDFENREDVRDFFTKFYRYKSDPLKHLVDDKKSKQRSQIKIPATPAASLPGKAQELDARLVKAEQEVAELDIKEPNFE